MEKSIKRIGRGLAPLVLTGALALAGCAGTQPQGQTQKVTEFPYFTNESPFNNRFGYEKKAVKDRGGRIIERYGYVSVSLSEDKGSLDSLREYTGEDGSGNLLEYAAIIRDSLGSFGRCITVEPSGKWKTEYRGSFAPYVDPKKFLRSVIEADTDKNKHATKLESNTYLDKIVRENASRYPDCNSPQYRDFAKKFDEEMERSQEEFSKRAQKMEDDFRRRSKDMEREFEERARIMNERFERKKIK